MSLALAYLAIGLTIGVPIGWNVRVQRDRAIVSAYAVSAARADSLHAAFTGPSYFTERNTLTVPDSKYFQENERNPLTKEHNRDIVYSRRAGNMKRIEPKERLAYLIQRAEKKARPWSAKKRDRFYAELMKTIALVPEMAADARITHLQVESIARQLERLLKLLEADLARRKES